MQAYGMSPGLKIAQCSMRDLSSAPTWLFKWYHWNGIEAHADSPWDGREVASIVAGWRELCEQLKETRDKVLLSKPSKSFAAARGDAGIFTPRAPRLKFHQSTETRQVQTWSDMMQRGAKGAH